MLLIHKYKYWNINMCRWVRRLWIMLFLIQYGVDSREDYYRHYRSPVPSFLPVPTHVTVYKGETAYLKCRIHNLGTKTVVWRKTSDDFPLTVGKRLFTPNRNITIETEAIAGTDVEENRYDLIINDVQQSQAGIYECQVSATEHYTKNITLHVLDPVKYKPELYVYGTDIVSIMENVHLICNATDSTKTPDGVDWFFNGNVISESKPHWQGRLVELNRKPLPGHSLISEIIIERSTMDDSGHYVCRLTKRLAKGLKVEVLNDIRPHRDPKRDMKSVNQEMEDKSYSSYKSGSSCSSYLQVLCITTLCYFITLIIQR